MRCSTPRCVLFSCLLLLWCSVWLVESKQYILPIIENDEELIRTTLQRRMVYDIACEDINQDPQMQALNITIKCELFRDSNYFSVPNATKVAITQSLRKESGEPIIGVLGFQYSFQTVPSQYVFASYEIPQMSASATSPSLSAKSNFPFFLRTVVSDLQGSITLAHIVGYFGWKQVACFYSQDDFGTKGFEAFVLESQKFGTKVAISQSFEAVATGNFLPQIQAVKQSTARVIILNLAERDVLQAFVKQAASQGLCEPEYTWILGQDAFAVIYDGAKPDDEIYKAMKGSIGVEQSTGSGAVWDSLVAKIQQKYPPTAYPESLPPYQMYMGFNYDAILSFQKAVVAMELASQNPLNGKLMFDQILKLDVAGATGRIRFDANGDRDSQWTIKNSRGETFVNVGTWNANDGINVDKSKIIWPMGDSNIPLDRPTTIYQVVSLGAYIVVAVLAGLGIIACLGIIVFILIFRHHSAIKASSTTFSILMILGGILFYVAAIVVGFLGLNVSFYSNICVAQPWMIGIAFVSFFSPLFLKTIRIWMLFGKNKGLHTKPISDLQLMLGVLAFVVLEAILLIVWTVVDPQQAYLYTTDDYVTVNELCSSEFSTVFYAIFFTWKGVMLFFGAFIAYTIRNVHEKFNEAKLIAYSIYNTFLISVIVCVIIFFQPHNTILQFVLKTIALLLIPTGSIAIFFVPKIVSVYKNKDDEDTESKQSEMEQKE